MKAVALVAHPDDCVIFAWPFIEAHPQFKWTIVYLTYSLDTARGREIAEYWARRNISVHFLGLDDSWTKVKQGLLGFDRMDAQQRIQTVLNQLGPSLILTHYLDGEYGHPHHIFVFKAVCSANLDTPKVYFASDFNYNKAYSVIVPADTSELPLHKSVIEGFQDRNTGRYIISDPAEQLLKKNK